MLSTNDRNQQKTGYKKCWIYTYSIYYIMSHHVKPFCIILVILYFIICYVMLYYIYMNSNIDQPITAEQLSKPGFHVTPQAPSPVGSSWTARTAWSLPSPTMVGWQRPLPGPELTCENSWWFSGCYMVV